MEELSSFGFLELDFALGKNQMCLMCGGHLISCVCSKIFNQSSVFFRLVGNGEYMRRWAILNA
jgi:hypothetical protein